MIVGNLVENVLALEEDRSENPELALEIVAKARRDVKGLLDKFKTRYLSENTFLLGDTSKYCNAYTPNLKALFVFYIFWATYMSRLVA